MIRIDFKLPDFAAKIQANASEIALFLAAQLQTNRGLMFDDGNAGRPTKWAPLKYRVGMPLSLTGTLRKSWQGDFNGKPGPNGIVRANLDKVTVGTTLAYAMIHNTGGVITPKNKPVLWIPLPQGKKTSANAPTKHTKELISGPKKKERLRKLEGQFERAKARYRKTGSQAHKEKMVHLRVKHDELAKELEGKTYPPIVHYKGKVFMLAKKVTIPRRPMDEWTNEDQIEIETALRNKLVEVMQRA